MQLVKAGSRVRFLDTPGVIPFDENDEYMQGLLAIKDSTHLKDPIGVAMKIIETIWAENRTVLESFYHVAIEEQDPYEVLELIGRQYNFLKKKGEVDDTRAAVDLSNWFYIILGETDWILHSIDTIVCQAEVEGGQVHAADLSTFCYH